MWANNQAAQGAVQEVQKVLRPPKTGPKKQADRVLWTQVAICAALLALAYGVRYLNLQAYEYFQQCYRESIQNNAAAQQEELVRFAMGVLEGIRESADSALEQIEAPQAEARLLHARSARVQQPPEGCSLEGGEPGFALRLPVPQPTVTSAYGWREDPLTGEQDFHTGVDLAQAEGTPVSPAGSGYVRAAGYGAGYGNYVRLMHSNGTETLYAHLQFLFVRQGEQVEPGTALGTVGHTGTATGPHLHFELLQDDVRYDPCPALPL